MCSIYPPFTIIAAADEAGGIGLGGKIPWKSSADMRFFRRYTTQGDPSKTNMLIVGNTTYKSMGALPNRDIYVLSRTPSDPHYSDTNMTLDDIARAVDLRTVPLMQSTVIPQVKYFTSLETALLAYDPKRHDKIFVVGGAQIYDMALKHPMCRECVMTHITGKYNCDVNFPPIPSTEFCREDCVVTDELTKEKLCYTIFRRVNNPETKYLKLMRKIMSEPDRPNRTGINTRGVFSKRIKFPLSDSWGRGVVPLLTTKFVSKRVTIQELLWFISGETSIAKLTEANVHIWDGNTSREFLDSRGLVNFPEGELGKGYGYQWRHFGGNYVAGEIHTDGNTTEIWHNPSKDLGGIDQLAKVIDGLRRDPYDRRHVVTAWNPCDLKEVALPACHLMYQFYVDKNARLNIFVNMRSADLFLGVPINLASYGILCHLVGKLIGRQCGKLVLVMVDCHVYTNHLEAIIQQSKNTPRGFPTIRINERIGLESTIDDITADDIIISDYYPAEIIKAPMAV
jgi:dihydrofolate reductase/thymidylate synthase